MCLFIAGRALVDFGEAMKKLAEVKDSLDIDVKQNFIDPLQDFIDKDMRDIQVESEKWCTSLHMCSKNWLKPRLSSALEEFKTQSMFLQ